MLDLGASIGADAEHLINMAVMGSAMARVLFDLDRPTVGLLNIGVEEVKGLEPVREAGRILREEPPPHIEYIGFVEGDDIGKGTADVVVTEGFAGNIALKTAEGTARQFADYLKSAMRSNAARPGSDICWRAAHSACCVTRWIRANPMVAYFSGSTVSSSRATAAPTPKASQPPLTWVMTWCVTSFSPRSAKPSTTTCAPR